MTRTSSPDSISTKLQQIASLARKAPETALTTLAHHIDIEWLKEAYRRTPKNRAPGIDGQTAEEYARNLETNLQSLLDRFKSGTYRAPPVRRVEIPKEGDKMRPIGVPTFEDKVLQRAVTMVLEAVYEQEFLDLSYGFRPNRSPHQALDDLYGRIDRMGGGWLIEVDIEAFFDTLGLTHYWAKSRKGRWVVKRKTAKKRLKRAIGRIAEFCRAHRHDPIAKQHKELNAKLRGHYEYYGVTGNIRALRSFWHRTAAQWRVWLNRRSYRAGMNRTRFYSLLLLKYPLAQPRITKPYAAAAKL